MAAISQTIYSDLFSIEKFCILIEISLKFVPEGPIDNKSASVQVMARRRTGDKPLPKPRLAQFPNPYMQHKSILANPISQWTCVDLAHP